MAIERAADSSRTTHGADAAVDACRYFAALILGALTGHSKEALLRADLWIQARPEKQTALAPEIAEVAAGSYKERQPPEIRGSGYVVRSLEAALWAFYHSNSFGEGCLFAAAQKQTRQV